MILDPHYWLFEEAVPPTVCDLIITEGLKLPMEEAAAGGFVNKDVRASRVGWFPLNNWVQAILRDHMNTANQQAWRLDFDFIEQVQFTYYGLNEFYEAHMDVHKLCHNMRKVSAVLQLSDPKDYSGGQLKLQDTTNGQFFDPPGFEKRGSIIIFPGLLMHQVTAVTEGTRYSAVAWATGPQLK